MVFVFSIICDSLRRHDDVRTRGNRGQARLQRGTEEEGTVQIDRAKCGCALSLVKRHSLWCEVCNRGVIFLLGLHVLAAEYNLVDPALSI